MKKPKDVAQIVSDAAKRDVPPAGPSVVELPDLSLDLEAHKLEFQLECLEHELKELRDNHSLRLSYTGHIFKLVVAWLTCVVMCVVLAGFRLWGFQLSEKILIAFITSTTINVVGLFVLVAKWMYPAGDSAAATKLQSRAAALRGLGRNDK